MPKLVALTIGMLVMFDGTSTATAHLITKPKDKTLHAIKQAQTENLAHARFVCHQGGGQQQRWACKAVRWLKRELSETNHSIYMLRLRTDPRAAICHVFGPACREAIEVALCESDYHPRDGVPDTYAKNGQYLGMFQMGENERATYGHGSSALAQARAAHAYYLDSGRDWSPWDCKP